MYVDQTSLLLALGFAAFALSTTLFISWLSSRSDHYLLTWAVGAGVMVLAFAAFSINAVDHRPALLWLSNMLLSGGFVIFYGATALFTEGRLPRQRVAALAIVVLGLVSLPFAAGMDALGAMLGNIANATVLILAAREFWRGRAEAPLWVGGIATLYVITALTFIPCAVVIYLKGPLVLTAAPSGWAEDLNSIVGLVAITSIGAMSLALNQARTARRHREEAYTDQLTGLLNRRALFERFVADRSGEQAAALIMDLDHFKAINDRHGHHMGDEMLRHFATVVRQSLGSFGVAARLGGEEFVVILANATPDRASAVAESIRAEFAAGGVESDAGLVQTSVSVGIAFKRSGETLDRLLSRADEALYKAKEDGRNRVVIAEI